MVYLCHNLDLVTATLMPLGAFLTESGLCSLNFLHMCTKLLKTGFLVFQVIVENIPPGMLEMRRLEAVHVLEADHLVMMGMRKTLHSMGHHGITLCQLGDLVNTLQSSVSLCDQSFEFYQLHMICPVAVWLIVRQLLDHLATDRR